MGVQKLIQALNLRPLYNGQYFRDTFRDDPVNLLTSSPPSHAKVERPISVVSYVLTPTGSKAKLHRFPSSSVVVHFYSGEPLTVVELDESGHVKYTVLGHEIEAGQVPQHVFPKGIWLGGIPTKDLKVDAETGTIETLPVRDTEQNYSLMGFTIAPGFVWEDVQWAKRSDLVSLYPKAKFAIELLTDPE